MAQPVYRWKSITNSVRLGKRATKEVLYLWFLSLPLARRKRIVAEFVRKV